jgi:hypothetical protein
MREQILGRERASIAASSSLIAPEVLRLAKPRQCSVRLSSIAAPFALLLVTSRSRAWPSRCHTRFSEEQNQANHMCAQEVHTYVRMKKYQNNVYIKRKTYYINTYNYQSVAERSLIFSSGSNITGTAD